MANITKNYKNVETIEQYPLDVYLLENLVKKIKYTMKGYGFSAEAVDDIKIEVSKHRLTLTEEERKGGASHIFDGGEPFFAINVSGKDVNMSALASIPEGCKLTELPDGMQTALLGFELGVNLLPSTHQAVEILFNVDKSNSGTGVRAEVFHLNAETYTRQSPTHFLIALDQLVDMRLNQLVPKAPAVVPPAPKKKKGGDLKL
jgi:hypothetical protein